MNENEVCKCTFVLKFTYYISEISELSFMSRFSLSPFIAVWWRHSQCSLVFSKYYSISTNWWCILFIYLFITYASFIHLTPGMFTVLDKIHPIMPPFLHEWHFLLVAFRIYQPQPSSASLFFLLLPSGKWLMPITGRGGSPTTRTGSSAKTPASSTWNIHWTCGSTRSGRVHRYRHRGQEGCYLCTMRC